MFPRGILNGSDTEHGAAVPSGSMSLTDIVLKRRRPDTKDSVLRDSIRVRFKTWQN